MAELEEDFLRPVIRILALRRTIMGVTQEELNDRIGCADNHLSKWEAGLHYPSLYFLLLWCKALDYQLQLRDLT